MYSDRRLLKVLMGAAGAVVAMVAVSCSVKEDRTDCPCFLTLDLGGIGNAALMEHGLKDMNILLASGTDFAVREDFRLEDSVKEYNVAIPKSGVDVMVLCSGGGKCSVENGLEIQEGEECPVVQMFTESFIADAGDMRRTVVLHRNYCVLSVKMKTSFNALPRPFTISVEGEVSGYRLDGTLAEGLFRCTSALSVDGVCSVRIPRQRDASLRLVITFKDSEEIRSFPVGEYILESGYDWTAQDLEDISVEMDFSRSGLTFSISKWKKTLYFEMTF